MIGRTVGHYRITQTLGSGGMGVVYQAEDLNLGRQVALKFLPPEHTLDEQARRRLQREARAASLLDHPNICTIYEIGQDDERMFIAMACYDGESLDKVVRRGALPLEGALRLVEQIARGLGKAHAAGIVHRDIKPGNVVVTGDGVAKILDFGLAKLSGASLLTKSRTSPGTVAYMSPEQIRGEEVTARSDMWALGVLMFELLTGKRPFRGDYEQAVVYSILNEQPESLLEQRPDLPPEADRVVKRMLRKDPLQRYGSSEELLRELAALSPPSSSTPTVLRPGARAREPIASGAKFGPYEIRKLLGAGGMGEVYLARDTRLNRQVAIKVLSAELSENPEFHLRMQREAKTISQLTHPNICTLFDVGEQEGIDFLVMEHLEGETLAERIARGAIPLQQALKYATEIASALERAHRQGVVHRDLKPGNIMLTKSGVKLLDFGLAKDAGSMLGPKRGGEAVTPVPKPESGKGKPLTAEGVLVGTLPYMAPEQLEGREADARTDIFAFGAILYEMITGKRAFEGATQASLIASIMEREPAASSSLQPLTPRRLDRLIAGCLAKDADDRFQTAHDLAMELRWIGEEWSSPERTERTGRGQWRWPLRILAAALAVAAVILVVLYARREAPTPPEVVRFQLPMPSELLEVGGPHVSPNGRFLAFVGTDAQGGKRIWLRPMDSLETRPLAGTEGTSQPFWSPDSRYIGFISGRKLRKIAIAGGPPETICDASPWGGVGTWSEDGTILFARVLDNYEGIFAVPAAGGTPRVIVPSKGQIQAYPWFLPGGRKFLYLEITGDGPHIRLANSDGSLVRDVMTGVSRVEYSAPGYLLFVRETTLVAQRFDAETGVLSGDPVAVAEELATDEFGTADFSVSLDGTLVYRTGFPTTKFIWLDRAGQRSALVAESGQDSNNFDLSADGRWLLYEVHAPGGIELRLRDIQRGVTSVFAAEPGNDLMCPLFTPDRRYVLFSRLTENGSSIVLRPLNGAEDERVLHEVSSFPCAEAFTPDRKSVVADLAKGADRYDIWRYDTEGRGSSAPVVELQSSSSRPALSPNGRWLAFQGDESGRDEIYVIPLEGTGARLQISTHGGREPEWGPDGKELFYVSPESQLMRVAVETGAAFDAGNSAPLFSIPVSQVLGRNRYLVMPDGERFLVKTPHGGTITNPVTVVLKWNRRLDR